MRQIWKVMSDNCGGPPYHHCLCASPGLAERERYKIVEDYFTEQEKLEPDYQERFQMKLQGLYIESEDIIIQ